jgi:zeaxanthin glucosyltransferase
VPMVAIPIAFDQPGISARIAHHSVGEFVDLDHLSVDNLLELIRKVLTDRRYAERAHYFKEVIATTRGLDTAADVIEEALQKESTEKRDVESRRFRERGSSMVAVSAASEH